MNTSLGKTDRPVNASQIVPSIKTGNPMHTHLLTVDGAKVAERELQNRMNASAKLCKIYFDIAARQIGEAAVRAERDRLLADAECPSTERAAWRSIDTAPKDGTVIWAFNGEQVRMRWIAGDEYALWIFDDDLLSDACPEPDQPTYWMPLPADPLPTGSQDGR